MSSAAWIVLGRSFHQEPTVYYNSSLIRLDVVSESQGYYKLIYLNRSLWLNFYFLTELNVS